MWVNPMITKRFCDLGLINPPPWLVNNVHYETIMGSQAYGVNDDDSDVDVYGFCIPTKNIIFPHLDGEILGFGKKKNHFEQFQAIKIQDNKHVYDLNIYNIVKYFQLCMENNPNMIDSLFTPQNCILSITTVGNMVRDNRNLFLHKGSWHKFKGYAFSQIHKLKNKNPIGNRKILVEKYGYDVKFGYHVVRLLNEVEQILIEGTIDLQKNREQLKSIRRGDWKEEDLIKYFNEKELSLEKLYQESKLRHSPDEASIKELLFKCLEHHYGSLKDCCLNTKSRSEMKLTEIAAIIDDWRKS